MLLGWSISLRVRVICHCYRQGGEVIRIISARKADRDEVEQYHSAWIDVRVLTNSAPPRNYAPNIRPTPSAGHRPCDVRDGATIPEPFRRKPSHPGGNGVNPSPSFTNPG